MLVRQSGRGPMEDRKLAGRNTAPSGRTAASPIASRQSSPGPALSSPAGCPPPRRTARRVKWVAPRCSGARVRSAAQKLHALAAASTVQTVYLSPGGSGGMNAPKFCPSCSPSSEIALCRSPPDRERADGPTIAVSASAVGGRDRRVHIGLVNMDPNCGIAWHQGPMLPAVMWAIGASICGQRGATTHNRRDRLRPWRTSTNQRPWRGHDLCGPTWASPSSENCRPRHPARAGPAVIGPPGTTAGRRIPPRSPDFTGTGSLQIRTAAGRRTECCAARLPQ